MDIRCMSVLAGALAATVVTPVDAQLATRHFLRAAVHEGAGPIDVDEVDAAYSRATSLTRGDAGANDYGCDLQFSR